MSNKLTRKELIEMARNPKELRNLLGDLSEEDRIQAELFLRYQFANEPPLPDAPIGWLEKAGDLSAGPSRVRHALRRLSASLTFDSWAAVAGGTRDTAVMDERRLRFEANGYVVDIRAERTDKGWDFVAGVIKGDSQDTPISLTVGKKTVRPGETGALQWSSSRLPTALSVRIGDAEIELPTLTWK